MTEVTCTVCPKGCRLRVDQEDNYLVTGHSCKRGIEYGRAEVMNPTRVVTSTVRVRDAHHVRCPVKTNAPIPKRLVRKAVESLDQISIRPPIRNGQVIVNNVCGTGIDFVATRDL